MKLLNEVIRIKELMNINEASLSNPITELALGPYIAKAWKALKNEFDNSAADIAKYVDNNIDNVSLATLRELSTSKGNTLADVMDGRELIEDLLSRSARMADDELKVIIKELSTINKFSDNIVKTMKDDVNFKQLFKEAIELEGEGALTPQQIKNLLSDYIGETNASKLYDDMRVLINPKKIVNTVLDDEFILPPSTISSLISATDDVSLQKAINRVLEPATLRDILSKAEELSKTTKISSDWFKKEFNNVVSKNPGFWTQLKRGEFNKVFQKLYTDEKSGRFSSLAVLKTLGGTLTIGAATYVLASVISAFWTADDLQEAWMAECMASKGYTKENEATLKSEDPTKYKQDVANCDTEIEGRETEYDKSVFSSWYQFDLFKKHVVDVNPTYLPSKDKKDKLDKDKEDAKKDYISWIIGKSGMDSTNAQKLKVVPTGRLEVTVTGKKDGKDVTYKYKKPSIVSTEWEKVE